MIALVAGVLIANCADGGQGCSQGCMQDCSCMQPLPGGFPQGEQLAGALQLRVSEPGLRFLEKSSAPLVSQLLPGGLSFEVPAACDQVDIPLLGAVHLCGKKSGEACQNSDPPCQLNMEITGAILAPDGSTGDRLKVQARVRAATPPGAPIATFGAIKCQVILDTARAGKPDIGFNVDVRFVIDAKSKRTRIELENAALVDLDNGDLEFKGDLPCLAGNLGFVKKILLDQMKNQLAGQVTQLADGALCAACKANDSECPGQATCDVANGLCVAGGQCVQALGIEGRLLMSELPGGDPKAGLDTLAWLGGGTAMPGGGITLGMLGGFAPAAPAACVKPRPDLKPSLDPLPPSATLIGNKAPDGKPFHIAFGIHKRALEHAGWAAYTTGALCLGIGTEFSDLLTSNTFSLLMPSLSDITGGDSVPMLLSLKPSVPPTFELGKGTLIDKGGGEVEIDEPLLTITLEDFTIDFLALVEQRPTRVLRLTADLVLPLAMTVTADGTIEPVIGELTDAFTNVKVTHSDLLTEKPEELASKFPVVLGLAMGFIPDALDSASFTLPDLGGLTLQDARFTAVDGGAVMAMFASLGVAPPPAPTPSTPANQQPSNQNPGASFAAVDTEAKMKMIRMPSDPRVMRVRHAGDLARGPSLLVDVAPSRSGEPLEHSWRLDNAGWSSYAPGASLEIRSPLLFLLGEHRLEVRSRVLGRPETVDPTPALLRLTISAPSAAVPQPEPPISPSAGGCAVASGEPREGLGVLVCLLGLLGLAFSRRRARRLALAGAALLLIACSSSSSPVGGDDAGPDGGGDASACKASEYFCDKTAACEAVRKTCKSEPKCEAFEELDYGSGPYMDEQTCEPIAQDCTCEPKEALVHGPLGLHSALAVAGDKLVACAYEQLFGDLVVVSAKLSDLGTLTKQVVDGVPSDGKPTAAPSGYRGGVEAAGDDVGLHGDIAVAPSGAIAIAYHDIESRGLKVATAPGVEGPWASHTVALPEGDQEIVGRFTSLLFNGENPAVAFLVINKANAAGDAFSAELRWASANKATPASEADWSFEVIDSAPMPCRNLCGKGQLCVLADDGTSRCQAEGSGCDTCEDEEGCVAGTCAAILAERSYADVPAALGMWPAAVRAGDETVVVYHDGVKGNLMAARRDSDGSWAAATILGDDGDQVGAFCSAAVDPSGGIHVAHQDVGLQSVHYLTIDPATLTASAAQTIDDGVRPDGRHPVGADTAIAVTPDGGIRVAYQDQLTVDLLSAKSAGDGSWTPFKTDDANLGRLLKGGDKGYGFYSDLVVHEGKLYGSSFYYLGSSETGGDLELFAVP